MIPSTYKRRYYILAFILSISILVLILGSVYSNVQKNVIRNHADKLQILADQAAGQIQQYFTSLKSDLDFLVLDNDIIHLNPSGEAKLKTFFLLHSSEIIGITRMDCTGTIIYTYPSSEENIGKNIANQSHIQTLLNTREPVISDVFMAVQGFQTVAFHVPVVQDGQFKGSLALLIPFDVISKKFLEKIRIGKSGYAWVLSPEGKEIFCRYDSHIGKTIVETSSEYPEVLKIAKKMTNRESGIGTYLYFENPMEEKSKDLVEKLVVYQSIPLENSFWSIAVVTNINEITAPLASFRDKLIAIFILFYIIISILMYRSIQAKQLLLNQFLLQRSEKKYKLLFHEAQDGILIINREGQVIDHNHMVEKIFKIKQGYLKNNNLFEFLISTGNAELKEYILGSIREKSKKAELIVQTINGHIATVEVNVKRISILDDSYQIILHDLTQQKQLMRELFHKKEQLEAVASNLPVAIFRCRFYENGRIIAPFIYDGMKRFFETDSEPEHVFTEFLNRIAEEDKFNIQESLRRAVKERAEWYTEGRIQSLNGDMVWFRVIANISEMTNDYVVFNGVIFDITEETESKKRTDLLIRALEQVDESVVITDPTGRIQYVNMNMVEVSGYREDELIGNYPRVLKSGKHDNQFYKDLWGTIISGKSWSGRIINRKKSGELYTEETVITPIKNSSGDIVNFVAVKKDITSELEKEYKLQRTQRLESLGRMAAGIAHDFNNLLTPILGYTELLKLKFQEDDKLNKRIDQIYQAASRAKDLTTKILAFSRRQQLKVHQIDLNDLIKSMHILLSSLIKETIKIHIFYHKEPLYVNVDIGQIEQVLINIVINAQEAMPEGGELIIAVEEGSFNEDFNGKPAGIVRIKDTGEGMEPEIQEKIFEPFFSTKGEKGTGLGLAMAYGIIKQHSGDILVESNKGYGTEFKVFLPLVKKSETPVETKENFIIENLKGKESILVVEDNQMVRDLVTGTLKDYGYKLYTASNGPEAIRFVEENGIHIDLLLTDVIMPDMNGKQLADQIRKLKPDVKVLFMSGYEDNVLSDQGFLKKDIHFISKPFQINELLKYIRYILESDA
ncbi:MAG: hypothetical protein Kow00108_05480 [Calditrichia bacterium]